MLYHSTRDKSAAVTAAQAIAKGLSGDGGLFVPVSFPELPKDAVARLPGLTYPARAVALMKPFSGGPSRKRS
jgi:threonine synthase